ATQPPASMDAGDTYHLIIGGDGKWFYGGFGGVSLIDGFTMAGANMGYVASNNYGGGTNLKFMAEAMSHEIGHGLGLQHQSAYDANGNLFEAYCTGSGDGRAPIMGNSYQAARGLWYQGTSAISATTFQDD